MLIQMALAMTQLFAIALGFGDRLQGNAQAVTGRLRVALQGSR